MKSLILLTFATVVYSATLETPEVTVQNDLYENNHANAAFFNNFPYNFNNVYRSSFYPFGSSVATPVNYFPNFVQSRGLGITPEITTPPVATAHPFSYPYISYRGLSFLNPLVIPARYLPEIQARPFEITPVTSTPSVPTPYYAAHDSYPYNIAYRALPYPSPLVPPSRYFPDEYEANALDFARIAFETHPYVTYRRYLLPTLNRFFIPTSYTFDEVLHALRNPTLSQTTTPSTQLTTASATSTSSSPLKLQQSNSNLSF